MRKDCVEVNEIDFLPVEYRRKNFDRKDQRRQALIVGALFLVIGASYTYQRTINMHMTNKLERAHQLHRVSLEQFQEIADVRGELDNLTADARAIAYLAHPWPQSQVVGTVVDRLPDSITLMQLRIARVPRGSQQRRREAEPPAGRTSLARDETVLRERYDGAPYSVVISGTTRDHAELHDFMIRLDRHPLIARAELTSLDGVNQSETEFAFTVTCSLTDGYGQPLGPQQASIARQ